MADPIAQRFYQISSFKFGNDTYNTIKEVGYDENTDFITDSGDADSTDTFVERGKSSLTFSINLSDPIQAQAIKNHAKGDIVFTGLPKTGGTAVKVTITGAVAGGRSGRGTHNAMHTVSLTGRAESVDVGLVAN